MTQFGYANKPDSCDHAGLWEAATIAGFGIMMCTGCGLSFSLMEHEGQLYWREVEVVTSSDLAEALRPVQADEDSPDRIQPEREDVGRAGPPLQVMPGDVEREAARVQEGVA